MTESSPDIVLVLGMHRSGTSMVSEAIHRAGLNIAEDQVTPDPLINHRGFWEDRQVVAINEQLFSLLDSHWAALAPLPVHWPESAALAGLRKAAAEHLKQTYSAHLPAVIKDPRLCRLLPFWLPLLQDNGWRVACVLTVRQPQAVAASLQQRDGLPEDFSALLYLRYLMDAERHSHTLPRVVIDYDMLLDEGPLGLLEALSVVGIDSGSEPAALDNIFDRSLRHQVATASAGTSSPGAEAAGSLYQQLLAGKEPADDTLAVFDAPAVSAPFDALVHAVLSNRASLIDIGQQHGRALSVIRERDAQIQKSNQQREYAEDTVRQRDQQLAQRNSELDALRATLLGRLALRRLRRKHKADERRD